MALTITLEGKGIVAYCDAISDTAGGTWSEVGGGSIEAATDAYLVGSSCIAGAYSNKTGRQEYALSAALDFDTAGTEEEQLIYIWLQTSTIYLHESLANEGLAVWVMTSTSDYRKFIIAAGDDTNGWNGDWKCFIIDPTKPGSVTDVGTYDAGNVNYIAVQLDITALAKGNNILIDMITVCKGLRITGTSTTPWKDIVDYCNDFTTRAWGIVQEREGVYYIYGDIYWGDSTQTSNASFVETSAPVIQFGKREYYYSAAWTISHQRNYASIIIEDASGYTTTYDDGVLVGTNQGRSGATVIGGADIDVGFDLYGGNHANSLTRLYNTKLIDLTGDITWGDDSQHIFYSGVMAGCSQFDPVGAPVMRNCTFAETTTTTGYDASLLWNSNIDIQTCSFISNEYAIQHDDFGSATYTNLIFSGSTEYDILLTSTGTLTVSVDGGTIPTWSGINGGTVSLPSSVTLTMTVKNEAGTPIENAKAYIDDDNQSPYIMNKLTNAQGVASETHTGGAAAGSTWRVRLYGYKPYVQTVDIGGSDISIPVTLINDPNQT